MYLLVKEYISYNALKKTGQYTPIGGSWHDAIIPIPTPVLSELTFK